MQHVNLKLIDGLCNHMWAGPIPAHLPLESHPNLSARTQSLLTPDKNVHQAQQLGRFLSRIERLHALLLFPNAIKSIAISDV